MKLIGEFAKQNNVTIKALHHYEKLGLINPAKIDNFTGYRYYEDSQRSRLDAIVFFKSLGFSLSEVKSIMDGAIGRHELLKYLEAKRRQALIDISGAEGRLGRLTAMIDHLESMGDGELDYKEIVNMDNEDVMNTMDKHERFQYTARRMYEEAAEKRTPLCALCMDIDGLKEVNDTYGRDTGDVLIERITNAMINVLMEAGSGKEGVYSVMERVGGDEFHAIVMDDAKQCLVIAQNMIDSVRVIDFDDVQPGLKAGITVGVASIMSKPMSFSHLLHLAESVVYELKTGAKGTCRLYSE